MSNPIALFEDLRDMYLRYLDSPFDLRYPDLVAERRALLNVDGRLFRQPLLDSFSARRQLHAAYRGLDLLNRLAVECPQTDLAVRTDRQDRADDRL